MIEQLEARRMLSASMVKDLNTAPAPFAGLLSWVGAGNTVFLSQDDGVAGWELYKTDGTTGGTVLVKDIRPGRDNSAPGWLTSMGGAVIAFAANDGVHGTELWRSDGTPGGTVMVKDILPGSASSGLGSLVNINGTLYFGANGGLWKSDGTEAGTVLLKTFDTGASPTQLINNNGTLYFRATTVASGAELWKSDGTDVGTVQVVELYNNNNDGFTNTAMAAMGGFVYFAGRTSAGSTDLWRSDGTVPGTTKVKDLASSSSTPVNIKTVGGRVYFTVSNPGSDFGLWATDGTTTTSIFSTAGANFIGLTDVSGTLFFGSGTTLYSTTGGAPTTVKTGLTMSTNLGASWVGNNGVLYLPANDGLGAGEELWKSDGVTTQLVKDIEPGAGSSSPAALVPYGPGGSSGLIVGTFSGANTTGGAIWKTDGTGPGTVLVKDISPATDSSGPLLLTAFKNYVYFIASEPTYSLGTTGELYRSDGTAGGTGIFVDLMPGPTGANVTSLKVFGDYMYFAGNDGSGVGKELWRTDGTSVQFVKDINPGAADSSPLTGVGAGSFYFFQATTAAAGRELWRTDGSNAGTIQLTNNASTITVDFMVEYNGWLYYTLLNGSTFAGMFRTDGNSTLAVSTSFTAINSMLNLNGTLYISGTTAANGAELFKITSVGASPVLVKEIASGTGSSTPGNFNNNDGTLFFTATTSANGTELWKSDGTDPGTVMVKDIVLGSGSPSIQNIVSTNGIAYFRANDGINGQEIWRSDGTAAGTYLLKDIAPPGATQGLPTRLFAANGYLYFAASDENLATPEAWRSDGTAAGTQMLVDGYPRGSFFDAPSNAAFFTAVNGEVFYFFTDDTHGSELWKADAPDFATLGAGGVLTITGTATNDVISVVPHDDAGTITVTVNGITENFGPGQVSSLNIATGIGNDQLTISGGFTAISSDAGIGSSNLAINVASNGAVAFNASQNLRRLDVFGSARLSPGGAKVLVTRGLSVAGDLNLTDNDLVLDYAPTESNPFADIQGRIAAAYDFGAWDGSGIRTSMSDALNGLTTLAVADPAALYGLGASDTMDFSGVTIDSTSVIVKYTYAGDANLDGTIDGGDYGVIDNFVQVPGASGYFNGDFNFDGVIDGGDYGIIDNNIQAQGGPL